MIRCNRSTNTFARQEVMAFVALNKTCKACVRSCVNVLLLLAFIWYSIWAVSFCARIYPVTRVRACQEPTGMLKTAAKRLRSLVNAGFPGRLHMIFTQKPVSSGHLCTQESCSFHLTYEARSKSLAIEGEQGLREALYQPFGNIKTALQ